MKINSATNRCVNDSSTPPVGEKVKVAVLLSGGGTNLQAIIDAVENGQLSHVELSLVLSNKVTAYGIERAKAAQITTAILPNKQKITTDSWQSQKDAFEQEALAYLEKYQIQLVVLAGFTAILSANFIAKCKCPIVNIHPSLIPAFSGPGFYGLRVHKAALAAGVKFSGATVHLVNEICDGGKILEQGVVRVLEQDTPETLAQRILHEVEHVIYPQTIERLCVKLLTQRSDATIPKKNAEKITAKN